MSKALGVPATTLRTALRSRVEGGAAPAGLAAADWRRVRALYSMYDYAPLWLESGGIGDRTRALVDALAAADTHALDPAAYPLSALERLLTALRSTRSPRAEQVADADVLLTSAFVAYGTDLLHGRVRPSAISQDWHIDPGTADADSVLARALTARRTALALASLAPQEPGYEALRRELPRYRHIVAEGGWVAVPEGAALAPGDTSIAARLDALAARLRAEDYIDDTAWTNAGARGGRAVYDGSLARAVARFQERHGLAPDSSLGPETVTALNVPADFRLGQIAANLERYRWLPHSLGTRYILVNVPAFLLDAFDGGRPVLSMKVVVGADYSDRATPVFSDSMSYVVFRPDWNVPDSIAAREIWPKAEEDPSYLERNHYEVVTEEGRERIRQEPGPTNALGLVKFIFPNDFATYLHDTSERDLFQRVNRAASHGCIRVERPVELAEFVLGWPAERVRTAMEQGPDDYRMNLPRKVPVYIVYFTAYVRDGALHFGPDLYGRDNALVRAVASALIAAPEAERHAEELPRLVRGCQTCSDR